MGKEEPEEHEQEEEDEDEEEEEEMEEVQPISASLVSAARIVPESIPHMVGSQCPG